MRNRFVGFHVFGHADEALLKRLVSENALIVQQASCISAFDEALPLAELEQKACMLSIHASAPVFFAAANDDTFLMGRCIMGFTVLRHCIGNCAASGVRETHAQSRDLADQLHMEAPVDEIRKLVRIRNAAEFAAKLTPLIDFSLIPE